MDRDRQLLFGVLAVQFEQLTAPQFVHAAGHWAADPSTDLADVLTNEGILEPADRHFVDNVMRQMIEEHGGSATAALEALGGEETVYAASNGLIRLTGTGLSVTTPGLPVAADQYAPVHPSHNSESETIPRTTGSNWTLPALVSVGAIVVCAVVGLVLGKMDQARREAVEAVHTADRARALIEQELTSVKNTHTNEGRLLGEVDAKLASETRRRERVESQLNIALDAAESFTTELRTRFRDAPEARPGLRAMLETHASMLNRIIELEQDPTVRARKRFLHEVSLGGAHFDLGDYAASIDAYELALSAEPEFPPGLGAEPEFAATVAESYTRLGAAYWAVGALDHAVPAYKTGIERLAQCAAASGSTPRLSLAIAHAYTGLARAQFQTGDAAASIDACRNGSAVYRTLLEANILTSGINEGLSFDNAVDTSKMWVASLSANEAMDDASAYALAIGLDNYGLVCANAAEFDVAETVLAESLRAFESLASGPNSDTNLVADRVRVFLSLGLARSVRGTYPEAHEAFDEGWNLVLSSVEANPDQLVLRELGASIHNSAGKLHLSLREDTEALASFMAMLDTYKHASGRQEIARGASGSIYAMYYDAIERLRHSTESDEALRLQADYLGLLRYFVDASPDDFVARDMLARAQVEYGVALRRAGNHREALLAFESALENIRALFAAAPENEELESRLAAVQRRIARTGDSP